KDFVEPIAAQSEKTLSLLRDVVAVHARYLDQLDQSYFLQSKFQSVNAQLRNALQRALSQAETDDALKALDGLSSQISLLQNEASEVFKLQ
ncbi:methyl-accepting chemotaxis protein, partial [Vibrio sp. Vb0592]|nr:methyl-accepting chemotaxis protein [Vibrio sp. Vb0592]